MYRVDSHHGARFLKLRSGPLDLAGLALPHWLHQHGLPEVVAPLPGLDGTLAHPLDGLPETHHLLLYPWIDGQAARAAGLSPAQYRTYGDLLRRLHTAQPPAELEKLLRRESFIPAFGESVHRLDALVRSTHFEHPIRRAMAQHWQERAAIIERVTRRCIDLGQSLMGTPLDFVLCHADIHTANLLVDSAGGLHAVDWDGILLAPCERDLFFLPEDGPARAAIDSGYGSVSPNLTALAYYRYEWAVQEIGDFGERVFLREDFGDETLQDSLDEFLQLFNPGDVIEGALRSDPDR
ncbi:MAG: phosphotransferase [Anaerolineae bacterium]|nr:phosphotransferase [Anaerolineae bacterium]